MPCRNAQNWGLKGWTRKDLEQKLTDDGAFFNRYLLLVFLWEDRHANKDEAVIKVVDDLPEDLQVTVQQESINAWDVEMMLGVLWPVELYKKHFKETPKPADVQTVMHHGASVRGVIKDPKHGNPIGTLLLKSRGTELVKRIKMVADSETESFGISAVEDIFNALKGRLQVKVSVTENPTAADADAVLKPKITSALDDGLDDIWPSAGLPFSRGNRGEKRPAAEKGENEDGKKAKVTSVAASNSLSDSTASSWKQKQLDITDQVILKARQTVSGLQVDVSAATVTSKRINSVLESLAARTKDKLLEMYSEPSTMAAEGEGGNRTGMDVLSEIRSLESKLNAGSEFLAATQSLDEASIRLALHKARAAGLSLAPILLFNAWQQLAEAKLNEGDVEGWVSTARRSYLNTLSGDGINGGEQSNFISGLMAGRINTFLEGLIVNAFTCTLRAHDNVETAKIAATGHLWCAGHVANAAKQHMCYKSLQLNVALLKIQIMRNVSDSEAHATMTMSMRQWYTNG